jgi:hypothetical protein
MSLLSDGRFAQPTYKKVWLYARVYYALLALSIVADIGTIIYVTAFNDNIMHRCKAGKTTEKNTDKCDKFVDITRTVGIVVSIVNIIVKTYFALVIHAFALKQREQENAVDIKSVL